MSGAAPDTGTIRTEHDGPVAVLILDRPGKLNAITPVMAAALNRALDAAEAEASQTPVTNPSDGEAEPLMIL